MSEAADLAAARAELRRRFPRLELLEPEVRAAGPNRVFTFREVPGAAPAGPRPQATVRITVAPDGRILKVVSSR